MIAQSSRSASRCLLRSSQSRLASHWQPARCQNNLLRTTRRFQSTGAGGAAKESSSSSGSSSALVGGLAGGSTAVLLGYAWYHFSGAKTLVQTTATTRNYIETTKQKIASSAKELEPNQALDWLRDTVLSYAAFIPGAKGYVKTAFDDIDRIREKHGDEVDQAVSDAVNKLKSIVSKKGASFETVSDASEVLSEFLDRVSGLAGDAAEDILKNHPQLEQKLGGSVNQLKQMSANYGPQVKEEMDDVWKKLTDIVKSGSTPEAVKKAQELLQEKIQKFKKLSDDAWKKGMEQVKPVLDKNPKVKELIEENQDKLKKGNFSQLWSLVKDTVDSGDTKKLEDYVKKQTSQAKESGMAGLDQVFKFLPGGEQIGEKIQKLQTVAEKHGKEVEDLLRETVQEIQDVLKRKTQEAEKVADKAKKDAN